MAGSFRDAETLEALRGSLQLSLTTNGLEFEERPSLLTELARTRPDKVHISIHAPENPREVTRVVSQVLALDNLGVPTGVNLLVRRNRLGEAREAVRKLQAAEIGAEHIVFLPARGTPNETPTPEEVAWVATGRDHLGVPFREKIC